MNGHQKCVCWNGLPWHNRPPVMSGHFGLDLGVAVHCRYYCISYEIGQQSIIINNPIQWLNALLSRFSYSKVDPIQNIQTVTRPSDLKLWANIDSLVKIIKHDDCFWFCVFVCVWYLDLIFMPDIMVCCHFIAWCCFYLFICRVISFHQQ